jgi:hypothetical protein
MVGVIVVRRYIVGIEIVACQGVMLMSKKRNMANSCVQNIQNLMNERELNDMSCCVLREDKMLSMFFILGVLILSIFIFLAIVGIEKIKIMVAMQAIAVNVKYCLLNVCV